MPTRSHSNAQDDESIDQLSTTTGVQVSSGAQSAPALLGEDDETDEEISVIERLQTFMAATSPNERLRVKIYKRKPNTGKMEWCEDYSPDQFFEQDLGGVRDRWGPGEYEFRLIGPRGIHKRLRASIAAAVHANPVAIERTQDSALADSLRAMLATQERILERLMQTQQQPPQKSSIESMTELALLMKTMREAFDTGPRHDAAAPLTQLKELMEAARELKQTTRELADDAPASEPPSLLSSVPKVIDMIAAGLKSQAAPQIPLQPIQPMAIPQSVAQNASPSEQNNPLPADEEPIEMLMLRQTVELLCAMARQNKDPEKGGEIIFEQMPDELIEHMKNPNWFDLVEQIFPIVKPHKEWLEKAKAHADKLFTEEGDEDEPPK